MTDTPPEVERTTVTARLARSFNDDLFAGLDLPEVHEVAIDKGLWSITFDGVLSPEQTAAAWARMESTDDTDQAHRALLRTPGIVNRCDLLTAYVLGDPLPDPIYPEPLEA